MLDMNGIEIKTGDVVEISGAYFKNDNGYYFVDKAPGNPGWLGSSYSLVKISKKGKISTAKRNLCSWPIGVYTNDPWKRAAAKEWNEENARIEVKDGIDRTEIAAHFQEEADSMEERIEWGRWNWGEENPEVLKYIGIQKHLTDTSKRILAEA